MRRDWMKPAICVAGIMFGNKGLNLTPFSLILFY
jgi:hypothetical protein